MRTKNAIPLPVPDKDAKLTPDDFSEVLAAVPDDCVLIGGQAVAWWAGRYEIKPVVQGKEQEITSRDIDFWGTRDDLLQIASSLRRKPALPHRYEMTLLVGAIEMRAAGKKTAVEILHAVPGLDSIIPQSVAVPVELASLPGKKKLLILSPVSLVLAKLHALRHFSQQGRQDLLHLRVSLEASKIFIAELLTPDAHLALWNCNRLIEAHRHKPNRKMQQEYGFRILDAVPIVAISNAAQQSDTRNRQRLHNFLRLQWPRASD